MLGMMYELRQVDTAGGFMPGEYSTYPAGTFASVEEAEATLKTKYPSVRRSEWTRPSDGIQGYVFNCNTKDGIYFQYQLLPVSDQA